MDVKELACLVARIAGNTVDGRMIRLPTWKDTVQMLSHLPVALSFQPPSEEPKRGHSETKHSDVVDAPIERWNPVVCEWR
jgi:hypothetical protein